MTAQSIWRRAAPAVGGTVAGTALVGGLSSTVAAAVFARKILTPDRRRPDDVDIVVVGTDRVVLGMTEETVVPGRYGLWLGGGTGHARVGDVIAVDDDEQTVARIVGRRPQQTPGLELEEGVFTGQRRVAAEHHHGVLSERLEGEMHREQ